MMENKANSPKVTVVTVCMNAAASIEKTIQSVVNQTYKNVEYIVVDGGSTDGTVDIIKKYEKYVAKWVSEPDKGIYNAMNKGILMATGEWINFMNAGDCFASDGVLTSIFECGFPSDSVVIYGGSNLFYPWGIVHSIPRQPLQMGLILPFTHQASVVKSDIMKKYGFEEKYKIGADMNFFFKLYRKGCVFHYADVIIVNYQKGGVSDKFRMKYIEEYGRISGTKGTLSFLWVKFKFRVMPTIKKIMPKVMVANYLKRKYRRMGYEISDL